MFKKSKNWQFSKGLNPSFWSKNGHFSKLFFLGNIGHENVFYDILDQKKPFYDIETRSSNTRKIDIDKCLDHGFGPKITIFPKLFFLGNKGQENVFCDILERKNSFLVYKNKKLKRSKNWHFSKAVNRLFWSKHDHYSKLFS